MTRLVALFLLLIPACAPMATAPEPRGASVQVEAEPAVPTLDCATPGVGPDDGIGGTGCPVD